MAEPSDDWTGYDDDFLGIPLPLPMTLGDEEVRELRYPRFTVVLEPSRRFAVVTGVNIDGATLHDLERRGMWDLDDRIPAGEQAGPGVYTDNDLDRGHLVRRRDPGWGTVAEAREATAATFFYTNAAPQAAGFNQSKELWLGLEDHVLTYADATDQRISVFTAPVLAPDDPPYRGIRIPRRFWKVAAWSPGSDGVLAAAGFVLDQTQLLDAAMQRAVPPLGAFRTFQVPIADIEPLAGVDLGALVEADVLTARETARPAAWVPLDAPSDIDLG
ncbi:DNA/RNA non-specific endonuclease [Microbacterium sp. 4R-513]|uniref:DNA/RNA non-specific endonuclease n=1 Tax=Microbacterium sp. 4R-513 TaxID=2567934 RepID=UPI0013E137DF|nr:DNA/RNA non-specific endonuclease [Microbacterium sp. 4R-513]QIG38136.1 DNA/RNA non-specific endonuclease [Microbacterium sp. 4R-513]